MATMNASILAPAAEVDSLIDVLSATLTAPEAEVAGTLDNGNTLTGDCTAVTAEVSSTVIAGNAFNGDAVAPAAEVSATMGIVAEVEAPSPVVAGEMSSGATLTAEVSAPAASVSSTLEQNNLITAALEAPKHVVESTLAQGQVFTAAVEAPAHVVVSTAGRGNVLTGAVEAPAAEVVATISGGQILTAAVEAPAPTVIANLINALAETYQAWLMEAETTGMTNYTNFQFHSLIELDGSFYGVNSSGVFLLGGDSDAGTDINSEVEFGISDLGAEDMTRLGYVTFDMRSSGALKLHVTVDGEDTTIDYTVEQLRPGLHPVPVRTGRGLRSRNWQFGVSNVDGADFDINAIKFGHKRTNRRAG